MASRIRSITIGDEPAAWRAAGYDVSDDGTCAVGTVTLRLVGRESGKRIRSWSLSGLATGPATEALVRTGELDGIVTAVEALEAGEIGAAEIGAGEIGARSVPQESGPAHPNGVTQIDHIVLLTPDQQRTIDVFEALGLPALRTRETDTYGAPFLQTFFRAGEVIVELIGPEVPNGDGPAGFFGLAFVVADLDATAGVLGDGLGSPKEAVQPGRRIATLRHKSYDISVATAFMTPEPPRPTPGEGTDLADPGH